MMYRRISTLSLVPALLVLAVAFAAGPQATKSDQAPAKGAKAPAQGTQAPAGAQAPKGPRPDQFKYPPLNFKVPKPADFRTTLSNGLVVFIAEDHEIPWFNASIIVKTGPFLEPRDKIGLDAFTSSIMRSGGSTTMSGEQITERMDFLGGSLGSAGGFGGRGGRGGGGFGGGGDAKSLSIHMRHIDEGLKIWLDVLSDPAFPEDKLRREKDMAMPPIRNRNRDISTVSSRIYEQLIYGKDSPITAERTEAGVNSITRDDLVAWYKKYWGAENVILVVSGDFKKTEMLQKLEAAFGKWRKVDKAAPPIPNVQQAAKAGVYMVQPEGATPNQGIIRIGHLGLKMDDPDYPAVDVMNYILGGGSFSSRITKIVRTDMGLAYTANSSFGGGAGGRFGGGGGGAGILYPGTFTAFCQTKNATVVFASQLMLDIIEGMRNGDITESDLKMAKSARVEAFPSMFQGISSILQSFARLEADGRPMDYYEAYLAKYQKLTLDDIKRVAQRWLKPDQLIIMICGNIEECKAGADKLQPNQPTIEAMAAKFGGRTIDGMAKKYGDGTVHIVSLK